MTAGRENILGNIRKSLNRGPLSAERAAQLEGRLNAAEPNLVPARGAVDGAERVALFIAEAEKVDTTVSRVAGAAAVPGAVAAYLAAHNLPTILKAAPDPALADIPWSQQTALTVRQGQPEDGDEVSVTGAFAGIAETGTLMLQSGPHSPTSLNFLPDTHIVVLDARAIDGTYEEAWSGVGWGRCRSCLHAAHHQPDHRAVAHRRYRTDLVARRPWTAPSVDCDHRWRRPLRSAACAATRRCCGAM